ncbi:MULTISPECIES: hypothetical protein [Xanthobacter]|uniref:Uncharacterized protein n=1 Tax=Xanthobacter aminoxidans TaxID=186280 RepID=A0ABW6ZD16_9HYPH|nr:hypothetical protein [Xanthobacter sp. 91]
MERQIYDSHAGLAVDNPELYIKNASKLALSDAAYFLLKFCQNTYISTINRKKLSTIEYNNKLSVSKYRRFANYITNFAIESILGRQNRDIANTDMVFDWLKRAHPTENFSTLQAAIRSAVNFDRDCTRCFEYKSGSLTIDAESAVEKAAQLNPGFGEETFRLAVHWTCIAMK